MFGVTDLEEHRHNGFSSTTLARDAPTCDTTYLTPEVETLELLQNSTRPNLIFVSPRRHQHVVNDQKKIPIDT